MGFRRLGFKVEGIWDQGPGLSFIAWSGIRQRALDLTARGITKPTINPVLSAYWVEVVHGWRTSDACWGPVRRCLCQIAACDTEKC